MIKHKMENKRILDNAVKCTNFKVITGYRRMSGEKIVALAVCLVFLVTLIPVSVNYMSGIFSGPSTVGERPGDIHADNISNDPGGVRDSDDHNGVLGYCAGCGGDADDFLTHVFSALKNTGQLPEKYSQNNSLKNTEVIEISFNEIPENLTINDVYDGNFGDDEDNVISDNENDIISDDKTDDDNNSILIIDDVIPLGAGTINSEPDEPDEPEDFNDEQDEDDALIPQGHSLTIVILGEDGMVVGGQSGNTFQTDLMKSNGIYILTGVNEGEMLIFVAGPDNDTHFVFWNAFLDNDRLIRLPLNIHIGEPPYSIRNFIMPGEDATLIIFFTDEEIDPDEELDESFDYEQFEYERIFLPRIADLTE